MTSVSIETLPYHSLSYLDAAAGGGCIRKNLPFLRGKVKGLPAGTPALVAMADLQGRMGPSPAPDTLLGCAVATALAEIHAAAELPAPHDCFGLLAGDFYTVPDAARRGGTGDVTAVWQQASTCFRFYAGVRGNHDLFSNSSPRACLDGGWVDMAGLRIAGVSGIIGNPSRDNRRLAGDFTAILETVVGCQPDVLILHPSPHINATFRGDEIVRQALERLDYSGLVVSGHLHWPQRVQTFGRATVLNVHEAVVTLEPN